MSNLLVKLVVRPDSHCVNLLDEILCQGPNSLSLVSGGEEVCFNAAVLCSLSPLLSTLVKQSTEDNCCSVHDQIFVFLPQLRNWKTMKQLKTFLSSGMVSNISRVEMEDLQNLLQMLGFNISCEVHRSLIQQAEVEGEEEQFFAEIKCEAEDEEELLGKQDVFTRIQLDRNDYEEMKNLIAGGSGALIDRDITDVGNIDQEMMEDEDLEISQGADSLHTNDIDGNYNTENDCIEETTTTFTNTENKLSKGSKRQTNRKIHETVIPTIDATEVVESVPLTSTRQDFECEQLSNSYSPCRNKTFPERPKRNLPNRKTKHSGFEIAENVCPQSKTGKKNAKVDRKGVLYRCSKCEYKSRRKWNVKIHREAVHEGVKYPCSKCDYKATNLNHLKTHIKNHTQCNECDYKGTKLKRHIQSVHNGICYSCSKCDFKSTHKRNFARHNKAFHEGVNIPAPIVISNLTD